MGAFNNCLTCRHEPEGTEICIRPCVAWSGWESVRDKDDAVPVVGDNCPPGYKGPRTTVDRRVSDATDRMAKTLGAEWVPNGRATAKEYDDLAARVQSAVDGMLKDERPSLPDDPDRRNSFPMVDGLLDYFPNALAEVSHLSAAAVLQHDLGTIGWDRMKSTDHPNKIVRHLVDRGKRDDKGLRHSAMVAWRALAQLQEEIEWDEGLPASRASRNREERWAALAAAGKRP